MKMLTQLLTDKPIIGTVTGIGGLASAVLSAMGIISVVFGLIGAVAGAVAGIITLLIKWKEIGGLAGIIDVLQNWRTGKSNK